MHSRKNATSRAVSGRSAGCFCRQRSMMRASDGATSGAVRRSDGGSSRSTAVSVSGAVAPGERVDARQHLVQDDAEGEQIGLSRRRLAQHLLGRHIADGARG